MASVVQQSSLGKKSYGSQPLRVSNGQNNGVVMGDSCSPGLEVLAAQAPSPHPKAPAPPPPPAVPSRSAKGPCRTADVGRTATSTVSSQRRDFAAEPTAAAAVATPQQQQLQLLPQQQLVQQLTLPSAAALTDIGNRLKAVGDWRGAFEHYYEALRLDPAYYAAHFALGLGCLEMGDLERALRHTEQAYSLEPHRAEAMSNLGAVHRAHGNHEASVQWYRAALRLSPNCQTTQTSLALALVSLGLHVKATNPKAAIKHYQESLVHYTTNPNAYYNLGVSYAEMNKYDKALINYNLTVHFNPRCAEAYNNMGVIYKERDNLERALMCYHMALQCNPQFAQALNNLGMVCIATGRLHEALDYLSRAVMAAPNYAEAYNNLGWLFWDQGDLNQALRMYECCIELAPTSKNPGQNRLLALNYVPDLSADLVFEAHRAWGERFSIDQGKAFTEWPVDPEPNRRLRIAYISPDFFHHSVSFFAHVLVECRNQEKFDVFLYSNTSREDDKTELFKRMVPEHRWRKVVGKSAQEVAVQLREDKIDILVEMTGHTANNRLDVCALKPCPVQITYIGYNNTTGLGAIDYRITDAVVDPPESEQQFTEELIRLPGCFLCYKPPASLPSVEALPALKEGCITFGSFSCLAKINSGVVDLWARVLREVPNSRLLIKAKGFYARDVQERFTAVFQKKGIEASRLRLLPLTSTSFDHLKTYNEVDIALDTFPYSNTTTTCESLVMGVPPICLNGKTHGSRVGATLLATIGLTDFIAETREEYVEKAKHIAGNLHHLSAIRGGLREALASSGLCDGPRFMEKYESVLQEKWMHFCQGRPPSAQSYSSMEVPAPLAPGPFGQPVPAGVNPITGQALVAAPAPPAGVQAPALGTVRTSLVTSPPQAPALGTVPPTTFAASTSPQGTEVLQYQAPPHMARQSPNTGIAHSIGGSAGAHLLAGYGARQGPAASFAA